MARSGGRAAVAATRIEARAAVARPTLKLKSRNSEAPARPHGAGAAPEACGAVVPVMAPPAFQDRALIEEGHAAAFRIDAGGGWATGALPAGAGENEIAKFLSEAIGLAKQMQTAMSGPSSGGQAGAASVQILIADPQAGPSRQSAIQVSVEAAGGTVVTLQPGGGAHLVAMLQHFLMALNLAPREAASRV